MWTCICFSQFAPSHCHSEKLNKPPLMLELGHCDHRSRSRRFFCFRFIILYRRKRCRKSNDLLWYPYFQVDFPCNTDILSTQKVLTKCIPSIVSKDTCPYKSIYSISICVCSHGFNTSINGATLNKGSYVYMNKKIDHLYINKNTRNYW